MGTYSKKNIDDGETPESEFVEIDAYGFTKLGTPVVMLADKWGNRAFPFVLSEEEITTRVMNCQKQNINPDVSTTAAIIIYELEEQQREPTRATENIELLIQKNKEAKEKQTQHAST